MVMSDVRDNNVIKSRTSFVCLSDEQLLELYLLEMESQADKAEEMAECSLTTSAWGKADSTLEMSPAL